LEDYVGKNRKKTVEIVSMREMPGEIFPLSDMDISLLPTTFQIVGKCNFPNPQVFI